MQKVCLTETRSSNKSSISLQIIKTIEKHCCNPAINIAFIAEQCGCSEGYVRQICRTELKCNPLRIIHIYRLEKACAMITATQKQLSEISVDCGYTTEKAFREAFKRLYDVSPQTYRNHMVNSQESS